MNSDVIRLLPDSVANQIAAGEVIQRPASVIKELVENSVDAGATEITIVVKDAGSSLIQVIDNGSGMTPTDARMAFERHATSKISRADDLFTLHTMGFRGEALPSIASVAQIEMRTMIRGEKIGTRLELSESKFVSQEPCTCTPGTNMMVKNIFFHMPARRRFLKKDSVELSHILHEFERLALVNTDVAFTFVSNDVVLHQFPAQTLKQRIGALFGKTLESQIAPLATETSIVKVSGFIGLPRFAKRRGHQQFLFVNGRNMRHPLFRKVIQGCYDQLVPAESQPSYFINFEVDPSTIDVNIHPQKHEIKFENEQAIVMILTAAIKETLGRTQSAGALDFDSVDAPEIPLFNPRRDSVPRNWDLLYENFNRSGNDATVPVSDAEIVAVPDQAAPVGFSADVPRKDEELLVVEPDEQPGVDGEEVAMFDLGGRYIVAPSHSGIMVISASRAHVRILYDRFMEQLRKGAVVSQQLIFPEELDLSPEMALALASMVGQLRLYGFVAECNAVSGRWELTAVPALLENVAPAEVMTDILEQLSADDIPDRDSLISPVALTLARSGAIKAGKRLTTREMDSLIADLFRCMEPSHTPDGLPVVEIIPMEELHKRFHWK